MEFTEAPFNPESPQHNLTLVFSMHEELGMCNSEALKEIIERIKPDVIFEELSHSNYQKAYVEGTLNNLESVSIRSYIQDQDIPHIPVDTYQLPENFERDLNFFRNKLFNYAGVHSFHLRGLVDQHRGLISQYGFHFLDSDENENIFEEIEILKERILNALNDEELYRIVNLEKEVIEKREGIILDNIYKFNKGNQYAKGIMFIGSGHRKSIKKKIEKRMKSEDYPINWNYYSNLKTALL